MQCRLLELHCMALGASSLGFHRISPVIPTTFFRDHYVNLYITFEGMNGEVNSKDKFCSSVLLGFRGIIVTLQRLCLQVRCIIYRVTLGTFLLLSLRDNDKYLMGMFLVTFLVYFSMIQYEPYGNYMPAIFSGYMKLDRQQGCWKMGLIFRIILTNCRYCLKNGWKIKWYKKAGISGNQVRAGNLVRIRFSELVLGLLWIINHEVLEEIRLVIGFINMKAVCHAEEMLVLWSEMAKPSLIARSIFWGFQIGAGSYRSSEMKCGNGESSGKVTSMKYCNTICRVWWWHIAGEKTKALSCEVFWFCIENSCLQYCLQVGAISWRSRSS